MQSIINNLENDGVINAISKNSDEKNVYIIETFDYLFANQYSKIFTLQDA